MTELPYDEKGRGKVAASSEGFLSKWLFKWPLRRILAYRVLKIAGEAITGIGVTPRVAALPLFDRILWAAREIESLRLKLADALITIQERDEEIAVLRAKIRELEE